MLRSDSEANEVVQEAFIKFILAAPELDTKERALAYMRATINNLSLNVIRARGSRPNLVAIDSDTSAERLAEIAVENYIPADESISAAEDAAIIKLALTKLSPAERAALVMWEMEGRSTSEIASELGIKESAVRHTVSRARASFVAFYLNSLSMKSAVLQHSTCSLPLIRRQQRSHRSLPRLHSLFFLLSQRSSALTH
jgi:RNA polymerase sigma factor (sigma-70 family)